jgi:hypothetical protein
MSTAGRNKIGILSQALVLPWLLLSASASLAQEVVADPPTRVARLGHIEGEVTLAPAGTEEWAEAVLNRPLTSGDRLWTEAGAKAELQVGSAAAYLDERTSFGFVELDDDVMQMSLTQGAVTIRVRRLSENETLQIETPNVAVSLKQPGEYHIEVDPQADRTLVKTRHGEAEVFGNDQTHLVRADEQASFSGLDQLSVQVEPLGSRSAFENWANDRERRETESRSAQYVSRDVVGYEDLDEHGDWAHEPEYGYVWRPRYVSYDWVPYRDGRWAWISPWGWTWVDHSRWGFAPFHYGRWAHVRNRWCWVPGPRHYRPVYAPALVGWVGGPHVGVSVSFGRGIGWFPLGPREVYIPGYRHSPRYIRHVNVSNTIIVNNTYITNVYAGRHRNIDYRYGRNPRAITAVDRGQFVGGRPVLGRVLRVNERELRDWRHASRPPALTPDRASVLAGSVRRAPPIVRNHRNDARFTTNRVAFDTERRQIEANGGRPIGRTHLYRGDPKERSDVRRSGIRSETIRTAPSRSGRTDAVAGGGSSGTQRIETTPARENSNRFNTNSGAGREHRGIVRDSSPAVAGRALRQSDTVRSFRTDNDSSPAGRMHRDDARTIAPRSEPNRSAIREPTIQPRIQSAPPATRRIESNRSSEQRALHSAERAQPAPARAEPRSAPQSEPRSSSRVESQPRSHSSSPGRSHGNGARFRDR